MSTRRFLPALLLVFLTAASILRAADPTTFTVGAFTFKRPPSWQWVAANSPFRKAQLHVPDPTNPAAPGADAVFFTFGPGQGGDANQNVSRWIGQFDKPESVNPVVETATINGIKVTRVRVESGTFSSGMPGQPATPMANYGLYGAILASPKGDVYIKLTGPAEIVKAASANFEALIQSPFLSADPPK